MNKMKENKPSLKAVPEGLQQSLEALIWVRKAKTILPTLPPGKLRESLEMRINELLNEPSFEDLYVKLTAERERSSYLQQEITELRSRLALDDHSSEVSRQSKAPRASSNNGIGLIILGVILIIAWFCLKHWFPELTGLKT